MSIARSMMLHSAINRPEVSKLEGENTLVSATATEEPSMTEDTHSPQLQ